MRISHTIVYPSLLAAVGGMASGGGSGPSQQGFVQRLLAPGRHESIPPEMDIYAPFLGDWTITGTEAVEPGKPVPVAMAVNFSRVLDGRAIQDIWSWSLDRRSPATGANYASGTTLRVYEAQQKIWRITWIDPVKQARVQLDARKVGDDIVQVGATAQGLPRRWTFTDIAQDSFTWRGEHSDDGGQTWRVTAQYFAKRSR